MKPGANGSHHVLENSHTHPGAGQGPSSPGGGGESPEAKGSEVSSGAKPRLDGMTIAEV